MNIFGAHCDYCYQMRLVPYYAMSTLLSRYVNSRRIGQLREYAIICPRVDTLLKIKYPELYDKLFPNPVKFDTRSYIYKSFQNRTKSAKLYSGSICHLCKMKPCQFHETWGFKFFKCIICKRNMAICGWCDPAGNFTSIKRQCAYCHAPETRIIHNIESGTILEFSDGNILIKKN